MISIDLYLKNKKENETLLYARVRWGGEHFKMYPSSIMDFPKIKPSDWNSKKKRAKGANSKIVNNKISRLTLEINKCFEELSEKYDNVKSDDLKNLLLSKFNRISKTKVSNRGDFNPVTDSLTKFYPAFLEDKKNSLTKGSIKTYQTAINKIVLYEKHIGKVVKFKDTDFNFVQKFCNFLLDQNYAPSYAAKLLKKISSYLNHARKKGINKYNYCQEDWFKIKPSTPKTTIYLSKDDLIKINEVELEETALVDIRDAFLMATQTGLRHSEWHYFKFLDITKNTFIVRTDKGEKDTGCPITPLTREIMKRRNNVAPKIYSSKHTNASLKIIGAKAGVRDDILCVSYKGNNTIKERKKKYEMIETHTGRRSFATNSYLNGVPVSHIQLILNHSSSSQTLKYIKSVLPDSINMISQHSYYQEELK